MPRSKSRATVRSVVSAGSSRWARPVRPHARLGQPVVQKRRRAIAEVVADRRLERRQHLQQDEHDADDGQRPGQAVAALDRRDEHAHRDREQRGQNAVQQHDRPPRPGQGAACSRAASRRTATRCRARRRESMAGFRLQASGFRLQATGYRLRLRLQATGYRLQA